MLARAMKSLASWLAVLLLAHAVFGALRLPGSVVGRRLTAIRACECDGHARYALQQAKLSGADAIATLLATTPPDAVVPIRGVRKGAIEFAPGLLWPRLCVEADALPAGELTSAGRPIAAVVLVGVQVGDGTTLRLEPR